MESGEHRINEDGPPYRFGERVLTAPDGIDKGAGVIQAGEVRDHIDFRNLETPAKRIVDRLFPLWFGSMVVEGPQHAALRTKWEAIIAEEINR